jgi:hypothetical protein
MNQQKARQIRRKLKRDIPQQGDMRAYYYMKGVLDGLNMLFDDKPKKKIRIK